MRVSYHCCNGVILMTHLSLFLCGYWVWILSLMNRFMLDVSQSLLSLYRNHNFSFVLCVSCLIFHVVCQNSSLCIDFWASQLFQMKSFPLNSNSAMLELLNIKWSGFFFLSGSIVMLLYRKLNYTPVYYWCKA